MVLVSVSQALQTVCTCIATLACPAMRKGQLPRASGGTSLLQDLGSMLGTCTANIVMLMLQDPLSQYYITEYKSACMVR